MNIIQAQITDAEEILKLQKLAYQSEAEIYNDFNIPPLTQTIEELINQFKNHIFLSVVENETIIGSVRAIIQDETCYIGRLIVHPSKQNQGIGTALMKEIEKYFPDVKRLELFTGSKSVKNIHLYNKLGYNINTFKSEKLSNSVDLVYMEKIVNI
jgi:ribosomal protein S18 acetylase RimI-like enzyme